MFTSVIVFRVFVVTSKQLKPFKRVPFLSYPWETSTDEYQEETIPLKGFKTTGISGAVFSSLFQQPLAR